MPFSVHVYVNGELHSKTQIPDTIDDGMLDYIAAAPPTRGYSRLGSGLPFLNSDQAFDNTPNKGRHLVIDGFFTVHIMPPNSYYKGMGRTLVPPTLFIRYVSKGVETERSIELRHVAAATHAHTGLHAWPKSRKSPMFYASHNNLPVRCQEDILRDSAMPSKHNTPHGKKKQRVSPMEFWGLRPPV